MAEPQLRWDGDCLSVSGEWDMDNCDALEAVTAALHSLDQRDLTMDMADVTFLDSSALAVIVRAVTRYDIEITVRRPSDVVRRAFLLSGLDRLVTMTD